MLRKPLVTQNFQKISRISRILVIRALPGLGDLLCCIPALRSLRQAFPTAQIDMLGLAEAKWVTARFTSLVDGWVNFPGYPGIPEGWRGVADLPSFFARLQAQPYDLALQIHGSGDYINPFTLLLGARISAGFYLPGQFCPNPNYFLPYPSDGSEVWRLLKLLAFLGIPLQDDELRFPLHRADLESCRQLFQQTQLVPERYVCIHAGASVVNRRWSVAGFAQIADWLAAQGYPVVLTGTAAEVPITQAVAAHMKAQPLNLAGRTDLGTLAALVQQATLVVCNDTGISHLAAALKTPSVVIFSDSDVNRWAPLNRHRHRIVDGQQPQDSGVAAALAEVSTLLTRETAYAS